MKPIRGTLFESIPAYSAANFTVIAEDIVFHPNYGHKHLASEAPGGEPVGIHPTTLPAADSRPVLETQAGLTSVTAATGKDGLVPATSLFLQPQNHAGIDRANHPLADVLSGDALGANFGLSLPQTGDISHEESHKLPENAHLLVEPELSAPILRPNVLAFNDVALGRCCELCGDRQGSVIATTLPTHCSEQDLAQFLTKLQQIQSSCSSSPHTCSSALMECLGVTASVECSRFESLTALLHRPNDAHLLHDACTRTLEAIVQAICTLPRPLPDNSREEGTDDESDIPYNPLYFWDGASLDDLKEHIPKPKTGSVFPSTPPYHRINFAACVSLVSDSEDEDKHAIIEIDSSDNETDAPNDDVSVGSTHDSECWECGEGGDVICCDECPRVLHQHCGKLDHVPSDTERFVCGHCDEPRTDTDEDDIDDFIDDTELDAHAIATQLAPLQGLMSATRNMMQTWKSEGLPQVATVGNVEPGIPPPVADRKPRSEEVVHNEFIRLITAADLEFERITKEIGDDKFITVSLSKREGQVTSEFCERDEALTQRASKRHATTACGDENAPVAHAAPAESGKVVKLNEK